ncbi:hypothetical protein ABPG72_019961 [Tetrahymena utriculariae]
MEIENEGTKSKSHLISDDIKYAVVSYKKDGNSNKQIVRQIGENYGRNIHPSTITNLLNKYSNTGNVDNQWSHQGREKAMNQAQIDEMEALVEEDPFITAQNIKNELELDASKSTINRELLKLGLKVYKVPTKPVLSMSNTNDRLEFAQKHRRWRQKWQEIVFSDIIKKRFNLEQTKLPPLSEFQKLQRVKYCHAHMEDDMAFAVFDDEMKIEAYCTQKKLEVNK